MLSEVEQFNLASKKIRKEAHEHLKKKLDCKNNNKEYNKLEMIARCEILWKKKSTAARKKDKNEEEQDHHQLEDEQGRRVQSELFQKI